MPKLSGAQLRIDWEKRALAKGVSLSSVLLQNLPPILNQHLHKWHIALVQSRLLPRMPQGSVVLDLACGYGRISLPIKVARPDIQLLGLDFAFPYCQHYIENVRSPAICASTYSLPFVPDFLDGIVAITALMYVETGQEEIVFQQLIHRLKPGGFALFLDPGTEFLKAASFFARSRTSTSGKGFRKYDYWQLGQTRTTRILEIGGCPVFSVFLPLMLGIAKNP
ncbi:MAG: class I SAM-dependent methyltransferase, partial [Anaerolineales bacterium]|nr:class I SAM-dependent methyltransferase [Anaerolineales bacterium]